MPVHRSLLLSRLYGRERGFSLLEVIVALVLLSSTGVAVFSWINQSLNTASRLRETLQASQLSLQSQALIADVNPAQQPNGRREAAGLVVEWTSEVVQPLRAGTTFLEGATGSWQVGLYRLTVVGQDPLRALRTEFQLLAVGQQKAGARAETSSTRNGL